MTPSDNTSLPSWLQASESYHPVRDRDGFVGRSLLSVAAVLRTVRLDGGQETRLSPSAPVKIACTLAVVLLTSLSANYAFVLVVLAGVLVRVALLPRQCLGRVVGPALAAAGLTFPLMLPAALMGQPRSALLLATKVLVSTGALLAATLSTPAHRLTAALRGFGVPNLLIMTVDLALRSIALLGGVAQRTLEALSLRSVGRNAHKGSSLGGVAGVVLLRASRSAQDTADAMSCRGFEGSYDAPADRWRPRAADLAWASLTCALLCLFCYLEGVLP